MKVIAYAKTQQADRIVLRQKRFKEKDYDGTYFEEHHILPKSLFPLWNKRKSNLILLTPREHFFCHQLLDKIYPNTNMFFALWWLVNDGQNKYCLKGSKEYERLKIRVKAEQSKRYSGKGNPRYGAKWTEETRQKILSSEGIHQKWTKEHHQQQKLLRTGYFGKWNKGKTRNLEQRETMRQLAYKTGFNKNTLGMHWFTDGVNNIMGFNCPEGYYKGRTLKGA